VNNVLLASVPILTTQLQDILNAAKQQLVNLQGITNIYQCNHTGWSFEVAFVEGESVHYATLSAIVTRILYHLPDAAQFNVTKTRVGVIKRAERLFMCNCYGTRDAAEVFLPTIGLSDQAS